jgi:hypothetical protein
MNTHFLNKHDSELFRNGFQKHMKNSTGTLLKCGKDEIVLSTMIQNQIEEFHKSAGVLQFTQKAAVIDFDNKEFSNIPLEECIATLQFAAANWNFKAFSKTLPIDTLFGTISKYSLANKAVRAGLIKISNIRSIVLSIFFFLFSLLIYFSVSFFGHQPTLNLLQGSPFCGFAISLFAGISTFAMSYFIKHNDPKNIELLHTELSKQKGTKAYENFVITIADHLLDEMPLVIIIDGTTSLDDFTLNVLKFIITSGCEIYNAGGLFWIEFINTSTASSLNIFDDCKFPVKRYIIQKSLELIE